MQQEKRTPLSPILRRIKFYFDILTHTSESYLYATDFQNKVVMLSPNMVEDLNLPSTVLPDMEKYWQPLIHPEDRAAYHKAVEDMAVRRISDSHDLEYRVKDRRGDYVWIHCRGRLLRSGDGAMSFFAGLMVRMGRRNQADALTGLLNKYQFEHAVKLALNEFRETKTGGALMVLGLDNFKIVNETYNRLFGDQVLKTVARQIENILPPAFTLYRLDGDEFGIVYPGASPEDMEKLFMSIQKCMTRPQTLDGKMYFCTISGGTVFYPQSGKDYLVLHKHAEAALDLAKRDGKNQNCVFSREQYNRWVRSLSMRDDLKRSVENGCEGFSLFYQPQVAARTQELIGAEALLRWKNPKGRMVAPMEFIPILEETKMIIPVGRWVAEEALRVCKKWQEQLPGFRMSVNVSYEQIKDAAFQEFIAEVISRSGMDPATVTLELTESTIVSDWNFLNQQFDAFRKQGINIAMDDFGTGYSSLAYLKNLSCDTVKIDRAFVKEILDNEFDRRLVDYTVRLCHSVDIEACIEGVEREDEYEFLVKECKADVIQGYLFGRPEAPADFEEKFLLPAVQKVKK